ncbi:hypothetical protein FHW17_000081 [Phyllobacterium sp. P30BS-XVII]|nr:hypothetical protein [Phyllobacterium sp. P30BS-XVII]
MPPLRGAWFVVRCPWFDKLTMRESEDAMPITKGAEFSAPHPEPVEGRAIAMQQRPTAIYSSLCELRNVVSAG